MISKAHFTKISYKLKIEVGTRQYYSKSNLKIAPSYFLNDCMTKLIFYDCKIDNVQSHTGHFIKCILHIYACGLVQYK